jgi:hypothetical protein
MVQLAGKGVVFNVSRQIPRRDAVDIAKAVCSISVGSAAYKLVTSRLALSDKDGQTADKGKRKRKRGHQMPYNVTVVDENPCNRSPELFSMRRTFVRR